MFFYISMAGDQLLLWSLNVMSAIQFQAVLFLCYATMASASMKPLSFRVKTDANGARVCSVDQPLIVLPMRSQTMVIQCGTKCTSSSTCIYYQFKSDVKQCELFDYLPQNFSVINQCIGYAVQPSKRNLRIFVVILLPK
jgi:hypothetical protein